MEVYQDQWVKGRIMDRGVRECASRYEALRPLLSQYTRPFTVLDLGAALGYFSFRILDEFPLARVVAIDDDPRLFYQCLANESGRLVFLEKRVTDTDLRLLANCEHFDVVLALNVIHHFDEWQNVLASLWRMGDHLITETPHPQEFQAINARNIGDIYARLSTRDHEELTRTQSHLGTMKRPMWYFHTPGNTIVRSYFTAPEGLELGRVTIVSNFFQKHVTLHRKSENRSWIAGINLQTYLSLNGRWPWPEDVALMIDCLPRPVEPHGDVKPWNFILDGDQVFLIDGRDDRATRLPDDFKAVSNTVRASK